ncbi:MAG: GHKL domain-containing protein, partial [Flavobacteriales bacterium]|nr:GHKL domain-containing protein [Flavobacteriales bacterium]
LRRDLDDLLEVLAAYRALGGRVPPEVLDPVLSLEKELDIDISIEELAEIIGSIAEGADRTAEIVRGLRNFSRLDEDDLKAADLNEGIRSTITVLGPQLRDQVELVMDLGELPKVECYAGKLNQVFMNILTNAVQALGDRTDGRIVVRSKVLDGDSVEIRFRDNGPGMPDHVRSRIFEPFYTTKEVGEGTGLGLSIAYNIVDKHHGTIQVESSVGMGTEFKIILPVDQPRVKEERA